jgi:hypothetical protein
MMGPIKRREFLKKAGTAAAGLLAMPYLLPSGRLFAATGSRKVNHVVLCLFAGGIRNLESVHKKEGNLMPYTFAGKESISSDILPALDLLPSPAGSPLQQSGTLFREFRYNSPQTVHYLGHASAISGRYYKTLGFMQPPPHPTLFEYYRKHNSPAKSALNAWWVSDQGGPFPFLNYSDHPDYGPAFGANMIHPAGFLSASFGSAPNPFTEKDNNLTARYREFLNRGFSAPENPNGKVRNSPEDQSQLESFLQQQIAAYRSGTLKDPWNLGKVANEDMLNISFAIRVLETFKPELLVVNMQESDIGHSDFSQYCNNMQKADLAMYKLWEAIERIPGMAGDTVMIALPEFGRNLQPNTRVDAFGRRALDHTGDPTSREIFCLVLGPDSVVHQDQIVDKTEGQTIDVVPTVADCLGFLDDIPTHLLNGQVLDQAYR